DEAPLAAAVLYSTKLNCGSYWEHVLSGDPRNPDILVLIGIGRGPCVTRDGGKTWTLATLQGIPFRGDPVSVITPSGSFLLAADGTVNNPSCGKGHSVVGALYQGPASGKVFTGTYFKRPPADLKAPCVAVDYPKIAFASATNAIYISGVGVKFENAGEGTALFTSRDEGQTFTEQRLQTATIRPFTSIESMDVTAEGHLRALILFGAVSRLLRFDQFADHFDVVPGLPMLGSQQIARVSAESERYWFVHTGPKIAIDRSSRNRNRIYILWADPEAVVKDPAFEFGGEYGRNFDIFLTYSDNDGITWSTPVKVNDDATTGDQFFPSIDVDSDGIVHVAFLDKRANPDLPQYDIYYAKLVDGKVSRNIRVNPSHVPNAIGGRQPGDYLEMVVAYPDKSYVSYPCGDYNNLHRQADDACITALDPTAIPLLGEFYRGDSTQDFIIDISDAINILGYLFTGSGTITCQDAADVNDDGEIDLSDALYLLNYLFKNERQPPSPFPQPGKDPTEDQLNCN
ncbi:MAG: dockerin type I domain-containing protein, partial [Nanoarchaeota archaeon]